MPLLLWLMLLYNDLLSSDLTSCVTSIFLKAMSLSAKSVSHSSYCTPFPSYSFGVNTQYCTYRYLKSLTLMRNSPNINQREGLTIYAKYSRGFNLGRHSLPPCRLSIPCLWSTSNLKLRVNDNLVNASVKMEFWNVKRTQV